MEPSVEVLIPSSDRKDSLRTTLESLAAQTIVPAVRVVDNASTDGTATMLAEEFPWVEHQMLERNLGFGAALNRGVKLCEKDAIIFLNNDAVAEKRFVESMLAARQERDVQMVAGCLLTPSGRVESLGVEIDRSLNAYDVGFGVGDPAEYSGPPPLGPCGGAALFERAAFLAVGGFDEAMFAYLEDVDLAIRMQVAGAVCAPAPAAVAWHHHSATLGARSPAKNELLGFARGHLLWKYGKSLTFSDRLRGLVADAVVYAGKVVIDGDLGGIRGRLRAHRVSRGVDRPVADPRFAEIPMLDLGLRDSLRRRLARRR